MRKLLLVPFILLTVMSMAACEGPDEGAFDPETPQSPDSPGGDVDSGDDSEPVDPVPGGSGRYLVLFCSRTGNTESAAREIQSVLGCDILEVEPETPYEDDYDAMLARARRELDAIGHGDFPPVKTSFGGFDGYDLVFIGYPVWYGSMATPMQAFLHRYAAELTGKRIALFATSGGSGISASVSEARTLCPDATFTETLLLASNNLSQVKNRVTAWLERLGVHRENPDGESGDVSLKMNITVAERTVTATMEDNAAARDFFSRLPLQVTLEDYNRVEKIFYPSPALTTQGVTRGCTPSSGDITIYAPWGNVAFFYKSSSHSNDLILIGRIDGDGIGAFDVPGRLNVRFEKQR